MQRAHIHVLLITPTCNRSLINACIAMATRRDAEREAEKARAHIHLPLMTPTLAMALPKLDTLSRRVPPCRPPCPQGVITTCSPPIRPAASLYGAPSAAACSSGAPPASSSMRFCKHDVARDWASPVAKQCTVIGWMKRLWRQVGQLSQLPSVVGREPVTALVNGSAALMQAAQSADKLQEDYMRVRCADVVKEG